ncbi:MAG: AMMECR1 domain-containing protein [Candidatus Aenigmarchaeota archaeon]|nr:AMMECR1 domain-containing protein [Candidatus Aenigmarchaeota archaeon]
MEEKKRLSLKDGGIIIKFVRKAVEEWVSNNKTVHDAPSHPFFNERHGILLTLYQSGKFHGRIGYPYPIKSAADVLVRCAVSVCQDPRSPALKSGDLKNVVAEVSILSEPHPLLKPYEKNFEPPKHGLVVVRGAKKAMMMPGDFTVKPNEAMAEIMKRAEIEKNLLNDPLTKFYKFHAQTFFETLPEGPVREKVYAGNGKIKQAKAAKRPARPKKSKRRK